MKLRLPTKRDPPRSGITRAPQREWPRHRKYIRSLNCVVNDITCAGPIEAAHYRTAANAGTSLKPHDRWTFPACGSHHREQHRIGQPAFERKYGLDLAAICDGLARKSTDPAMRAAMDGEEQ